MRYSFFLTFALALHATSAIAQQVTRSVPLSATSKPMNGGRERWTLSFSANGVQSTLLVDLPIAPAKGGTVVTTFRADRTTDPGPICFALLKAGGVGPVGAEVGAADSLLLEAKFEGDRFAWDLDLAGDALPYSPLSSGTWEVFTIALRPPDDPKRPAIPLVLGLDRSTHRAALMPPLAKGAGDFDSIGPVIVSFTLFSLWRVQG